MKRKCCMAQPKMGTRRSGPLRTILRRSSVRVRNASDQSNIQSMRVRWLESQSARSPTICDSIFLAFGSPSTCT